NATAPIGFGLADGGWVNEICTHTEFFNPGAPSLLQLDFRTSVFELLLDLGGFVLVDVRLHFLGSAFDQVLGFLEAQAGDRTHFLDHVDLLVASVGQDDGELGLFRGAGGGRSGGSGNRSGGGNAPLLFQELGEVRGFQDGQGGQVFNELFDLRH